MLNRNNCGEDLARRVDGEWGGHLGFDPHKEAAFKMV